jgi:hypothetical protein
MANHTICLLLAKHSRPGKEQTNSPEPWQPMLPWAYKTRSRSFGFFELLQAFAQLALMEMP